MKKLKQSTNTKGTAKVKINNTMPEKKIAIKFSGKGNIKIKTSKNTNTKVAMRVRRGSKIRVKV